jgi:amino-acid N-acetyltransferase
MPTIQIRPAVEADQSTIKQLVSAEQLDPSALHWSHFVIAENNDQVVGIGQIRPHPRGRELGSLVVQEDFREQGVGTLIVNALLEKEKGDVFLECESSMGAYYSQFGFVRIPWYLAPYPLNIKAGAAKMIVGFMYKLELIVMKRPQPPR